MRINGRACLTYILQFILLTSWLFCSCQKDDSNNDFSPKEIDVEIIGEYVLQIDSTFSLTSASAFSVNNDHTRMVTLSGNIIYDFDLQKRRIENKIELPTSGPNGIPSRHTFDGMSFLADSNYVYSSHWNDQVFLYQGEKKSLLFTRDTSVKAFEYLIGSKYDPIISSDKHILLPQSGNTEQNKEVQKAFIALNKKDLSHQRVINYSNIFIDNYWGNVPYTYWQQAVYVPSQKRFYVSSRVDHKIQVYNDNFVFVEEKFMRSSHIDPRPFYPKPYKEMMEAGLKIDNQKVKDFYRTLSMYNRFFHDPVNKLIYRFVKKVIPDGDGNTVNSFVYAVVSDENLNYLGEWKVPAEYEITYSFVGPNGLLLFNDRKYVSETDYRLFYDLIKPVIRKDE